MNYESFEKSLNNDLNRMNKVVKASKICDAVSWVLLVGLFVLVVLYPKASELNVLETVKYRWLILSAFAVCLIILWFSYSFDGIYMIFVRKREIKWFSENKFDYISFIQNHKDMQKENCDILAAYAFYYENPKELKWDIAEAVAVNSFIAAFAVCLTVLAGVNLNAYLASLILNTQYVFVYNTPSLWAGIVFLVLIILAQFVVFTVPYEKRAKKWKAESGI